MTCHFTRHAAVDIDNELVPIRHGHPLVMETGAVDRAKGDDRDGRHRLDHS
jgi:hypothetical protein